MPRMRAGFTACTCAALLAPLTAYLSGQPSGSAALLGIAHVAFRVADVHRTREFYGRLGFEQAFEFSDGQGIATSYVKISDRQFIELYRRDAESQPLGLMHVCFDVEDIAALRGAYSARGLQPSDSRKARAGNLLFNLYDPEGQLLEYSQYLPGSLHSNDRGHHVNEDRISAHMISAAMTVKDVSAERDFFMGRLGFATRPRSERLALPGHSGEEIEIQASALEWKPVIDLAVQDVARAVEKLRARGLGPRVSGPIADVADPDGVRIRFIATQGR